MKTKLIATVFAAIAATALPAIAGSPKTTASSSAGKPNVFCSVPLVRSTPLCNTYNQKMTQQLAPQPVQPARR